MADDALKLKDGAGQTDGKLLSNFIEKRDGAAFEVLMRRHGPMVLGVCLRVLRNQHDAEDASQATFLVLVRKAASVVPREMVGNWLHGVAHQTAIRVRALNAKRKGRETQVTVMPEPDVAKQEARDSLLPWVDQELTRLPEKYRVPIVLCDLEGRTSKEVAHQLGWPEGTVSTRLSRGRALLAKRLAKHGLVFSGEALAVLLANNVASASLPPALVAATVKTATLMAAGKTATTGLISAKVLTIAEGVLTSMFLSKLTTVAVVSIIVCLLGVGVGASILSGQAPQSIGEKAGAPQPAKLPKLVSVTLNIVDLVPQKGADGKIGPGKKEFDEKKITGLLKKGVDVSNPENRIERLIGEGHAVGTRKIQYTAIENQEVDFSNLETKHYVYNINKAAAGIITNNIGPRPVGTIVKTTVQLAEEKAVNIDLFFYETRPYPPDVGFTSAGPRKEMYVYGIRPILDVGDPVVKNEKSGKELQVYQFVNHTLKTKLKVPLGEAVVAPGIQATTFSFASMGKRSPGEVQIMLFVSAEVLDPAAKGAK